MTQIAPALTRLFERHRIVFWYDDQRELREEFDALDLPDVEKIVLENNQFGVKYRILRQEPECKFLLYHDGPAPEHLNNWLLDVQLAHVQFVADRASLWATEVGLGLEFLDLVRDHAGFFQSGERRKRLRRLLAEDDTTHQIRLKLLAVCAGTEPNLDDILEALLGELADDGDERMRLIARSGLEGFLWDAVERAYGYTSATPGVRDFAIALFKACYALALEEPAALAPAARVFMQRWQDSVRHRDAFETLSAQCAEILDIRQDLERRAYTDLVDVDLFELVERKILHGLVQDVAARTIRADETEELVRRRRQSLWFKSYCHLYAAAESAAHFLALIGQVELTMRSLAHGVEQYTRVWFRLDQYYRHFIYHLRQSGQTTLLQGLLEQVDNHYTNSYLLPLNNRWQEQVDAAQKWQVSGVLPQQAFYGERVERFLSRGNKVAVIVSDALRYELGEELLRRVRQEDRFDATLEAALAMLPSFTQLGMAALLPHKTLTLDTDGGLAVRVDDQRSQGTEQRKKILEEATGGRATAIRADDLLKLNRDESRALMRDHEVVYVYHNRVDATGDQRESEERVFDAAEDALEELVQIIKKLTNANANNMLVTADHGFIYQHGALDESDFASEEVTGAQIILQQRRFVLGRGLDKRPGVKHFTSAAVGLAGEMEIVIPKSINRLRLRGAGSRYVHGGATLQEVVIPLLQINKKRKSDIELVEVDILRGGNEVISTGQLSVTLLQLAPVDEKVQPRQLRAGLYTQAGELISDSHDLTFDLTAASVRDREQRVQFILTSQAEAANGQEVELRLEEQVAGTSHYQVYKKVTYRLRRIFDADFDL